MNFMKKTARVSGTALALTLVLGFGTSAARAYKLPTDAFGALTPQMDLFDEPQLMNEQKWPLDGITEIEVEYRNDSVRVYPSETREIILREYLSEHDDSCHAVTELKSSRLKISHGQRPKGLKNGYQSRIELYVPAGFDGTLKLTNQTGSLRTEHVSAARYILKNESGSIRVTGAGGTIDCENQTGSIRVEQAADARLLLKNENGSIRISESSGVAQCENHTGSINIEGGAVSGTFHSQNGSVEFSPASLSGSVEVATQTGSIRADFPQDVPFSLSASTDTGKITNQFSNQWADGGKTLNGTWGTDPAFGVTLSTQTASIRIDKK